MQLNAVFACKETQFEPRKCTVERIIELAPGEHASFWSDLQRDQDFITEFNKDMRASWRGNTIPCLLVLGEHCNDGVLIDTQGYDYARYTSFVPGARQLLAAEAMHAEKVFVNEVGVIEGADLRHASTWLVHARELAEVDAGAAGPAAHFDYCRRLQEFRDAFHNIGRLYETSSAEIFNAKALCRPEELFPAADWINHSGDVTELPEFIQSGAFQPVTYAADMIAANYIISGGNVDVQCLTDFQGYYFLNDEQMEQLWNELRGREEIAGLEIDEENNEFRVTYVPRVPQVRVPEPLTQDDLDIIHARHMLWCHDQPGGEKADLTGQELRDLCFMRMRFSYASFVGATLENCCLDEGRFFGCDFGDATMVNCTALGGTEFVGAKFANAAITGCNFEKAWCMETSFPGTWIERCDFTGANLEGADFSQAELVDCEGLDDISQGMSMRMGG